MNRVAGLVGLVLCALSLSAPSARAQQPATDAAALDPSESACVAQSIGSPCDSSTTTAGGTCLPGCCCHYVTDPEGSTVCAPCLACSDTSYKDPAFKSGACSDGGAITPPDSGAVVPFVDSGMTVGTPAPGPTPTSSSNGGCSMAAGPGRAPGGNIPGAMVLVGLVAALARRRRAR